MEPTEAVPSPSKPAPAPIVFYSSPDVVVTDRLFACSGRKIALDRLVNVHKVRAPRSALAVNGAIAAAGITVVLVVAGSLLDTAGWIGGLVVLAIPVVLAVVGLTRRRPWELWADVTSSDPALAGLTAPGLDDVSRVLLLRIDDTERYHQICRAIVRAQQYGRS